MRTILMVGVLVGAILAAPAVIAQDDEAVTQAREVLRDCIVNCVMSNLPIGHPAVPIDGNIVNPLLDECGSVCSDVVTMVECKVGLLKC